MRLSVMKRCSDVLLQIEAEVSGCGLMISGLYHAHDNLRDNHVDTFR